MKDVLLICWLIIIMIVVSTPPATTASHPFARHYRYKRQFDISNTPQIDLNITVPYIFSARLYPYGDRKGDQMLRGLSQTVKLQKPFVLLGKEYEAVHVRRDGAIGLSAVPMKPSKLPTPQPIIAIYWMPSKGGKVHFRESNDLSILHLAQSEVNIQYRYGSSFKPNSVFVVTWENTREAGDDKSDGNLFQVAIIMGDWGTFAHVVYSKLKSNNDAIAGFSGVDAHYELPGSGTQDAMQLSETSNIGIPGEFLFRIDLNQVFLCGAGYKGIECTETCANTEWGLDCSRHCHCANSTRCNAETGACPNSKCNSGWTNPPVCDEDVNECTERDDLCPPEQPDCVNTAGAYLCICYEYDNATNVCKGLAMAERPKSAPIPVKVMPVEPKILSNRPNLSNRLPTLPTPTSRTAATAAVGTVPKSLPTDGSETVRFNSITIRPSLAGISPACRCGENAQCLLGVCQCKSGWTGDGLTCVDINECFGEPSVCGMHATCENSPGSYSCQCLIGYIFDSDGKCVDMDECAEGIVICGGGANSSVCVNTDGGYECRCATGYSGNPKSPHGCVDVDECQLSDFYCGERGVCRNLIGSYECECEEGFQRDQYTGQCVDIDECRYEPCDKAAVCSNMHGSFKCSCIDGFVGNGVECHETILFPADSATFEVPSRLNAVVDYPLRVPVRLFGSNHRALFVSSNGGISFGEPLPLRLDGNIRFPAFLPLYEHYTFQEDSRIIAKIVDESDIDENDTVLTKLSLAVHNKFHQHDFRARSAIIVLYERMLQVNTDKVNTFEVVIARGDNATFVFYLYEEIESENGLSGFASGVEFYELPFEMLANQSNIGERGKWIFRIDGPVPIHCPAGTVLPPLCQKECDAGTWGFRCENKCHCRNDIPCDFATGFCSNAQCAEGWMGINCSEDVNECITERHNCSSASTCINEIGSYRCKCDDFSVGDGITCKQMDVCYMRYREKCSPNAFCDDTPSDGAECVCNDGFHGDGLNCLRINAPADDLITPLFGNAITSVPIGIPKSVEVDGEVEETPFVMHNWVTETVEQQERHQLLQSVNRKNERHHKLATSTSPAVAKDYEDIENELYIGGKTMDEGDHANMWFIVVPVALIALWVLLIVIVIAVCCRKKRKTSPLMFKEPVGMTGWRIRSLGSSYPAPYSAQY